MAPSFITQASPTRPIRDPGRDSKALLHPNRRIEKPKSSFRQPQSDEVAAIQSHELVKESPNVQYSGLTPSQDYGTDTLHKKAARLIEFVREKSFHEQFERILLAVEAILNFMRQDSCQDRPNHVFDRAFNQAFDLVRTVYRASIPIASHSSNGLAGSEMNHSQSLSFTTSTTTHHRPADHAAIGQTSSEIFPQSGSQYASHGEAEQSQQGDGALFACPVAKHDFLHRLPPRCHYRGATTMSKIEAHVKRKDHIIVPSFARCNNCWSYYLTENGPCHLDVSPDGTRGVQYRGSKQSKPWRALYTLIYPNCLPVPSHYMNNERAHQLHSATCRSLPADSSSNVTARNPRELHLIDENLPQLFLQPASPGVQTIMTHSIGHVPYEAAAMETISDIFISVFQHVSSALDTLIQQLTSPRPLTQEQQHQVAAQLRSMMQQHFQRIQTGLYGPPQRQDSQGSGTTLSAISSNDTADSNSNSLYPNNNASSFHTPGSHASFHGSSYYSGFNLPPDAV